MSKLTFTIDIHAPKAKVWDVMLDEQTYREWTAAFHEGSYYVGGWDTDTKIKFVSTDDNGRSGIFGRIAKNRPGEYISIEYQGEIKNGVEDSDSADAKQWIGAHENYSFKETDGVTTVDIELDGKNIKPEMAQMFEGMWPPALQKLKEIAER
jgi:uncharacterized protein YndB with AHSA1/START domain